MIRMLMRHCALVTMIAFAIFPLTSNAEELSQESLDTLRQQVQQLQQQIMHLERKLEHNTARDKEERAVAVQAAVKAEHALDKAENAGGMLRTSTSYADDMLHLQRWVVGKNRRQLMAVQNGELDPGHVYLSGMLKGTLMAETTNETGKFPILSRFPNQHSGDSGTRAVIQLAALGVTVPVNDWLTAYSQIEYTETEYPGQEELQMRKAFVTIGNLDESPFYGFFGRNSIDFGRMESYNPFTHTMNNHYFQAVSDDPVIGVGYYDHGWDVVLTGINGGRQLRVADNEETDQMSNFAINLRKSFEVWDDAFLHLGGGYLYSTIYNRDFTHHTRGDLVGAPVNQLVRNGAYDLNIELNTPSFDVMAEFTQTERRWPATDWQVTAITGQAAWKHMVYARPAKLSLVFGYGEQGDDGTEFERMIQAVTGYEVRVFENLYLGAEYLYNDGFVPLVNITQVSDRDVQTHTLVVGGRLIF